MKAITKLDYVAIPVNQDFKVRLLVRLESDKILENNNQNLNLALVMDRSGSMSGDKIKFVKKAILKILSGLKDDDKFSLVIFDDDIENLIPPISVKNRSRYIELINEIEARGSTDLFGGYKLGFHNAKKYYDKNRVNRIILLTDGLANVGICDTNEIAAYSNEYAEKGITTTTLGVGLDYNEELLTKMAESGNGNTYFIEDSNDIEQIFEKELSSLTKICADDIRLEIEKINKGLKIIQLNKFKLSDNTFHLGEIYSESSKSIMFEISIPAQKEIGEFNFSKMKLSFDYLVDGEISRRTIKLENKIKVVSDKEFKKVVPDQLVLTEACFLLIGKLKAELKELGNKGNYDEAAERIINVINFIENLELDDPLIDKEIKDLRSKARYFKDYREDYYDEREAKYMHYESNFLINSKKEDKVALNLMKARKVSYAMDMDMTRKVSGKYIVLDISTEKFVDKNKYFENNLNELPHLIQIGWRVIKNGKVKSKNDYFINPSGFEYTTENEKYANIVKDTLLQKGQNIKEVLEKLKKDIDTSELIISYNTRYVIKILDVEFRRHGITTRINLIDQFCLKRDFPRLLIDNGVKLNKNYMMLEDSYKFLFNKEIKLNNDAFEDVECITQCFNKINNSYDLINMK